MTAAARATPAPLYFVNAPVDWAVMGGLSLIAAAVLALVPAELGAWPPLLALVCNWPHFAATNHRLYGSRAHLRQYPLTAVLIPLIVLAGLVWAFLEPDRIAPLYVKFMLLWSPYHFSGQTIGLSLLYARRAGIRVDDARRRSVTALVLATYLANTAHTEAGTGVRVYAGITHPKLDVAPWVGSGLDVMVVLLGAVYLWTWLRPAAANGRRVPLIVVLPVLAQSVWYVAARGLDTFLLFVPFFHSLEYLLAAWAVHLTERLATGREGPSPSFVRLASMRWMVTNMALGIALFVGCPYLLAATGRELSFAMATVSAAVQLHHFFVDGVIWKLRSPRAVSPLLVSVGECAGQRPPLAEAA